MEEHVQKPPGTTDLEPDQAQACTDEEPSRQECRPPLRAAGKREERRDDRETAASAAADEISCSAVIPMPLKPRRDAVHT
jgi:hypothetical protein